MTEQHTILITTSSFGNNDANPLTMLKDTGLEVILNPMRRKLTENEALDLVLKYQPAGLLAGVEPLTANVLQQASGLKAIARAGIGMDSVDLEAAMRLGISVTNTPDAPTIPVAELTMGMILTSMRKLHVSDASIRANTWERPMGELLFGKTVGIVGCGRIGSRLAEYLKAFGCNLLGVDPACQSHADIKMVAIDDLLSGSDIVTLHLPYSTETHHFMNAGRIKLMKPGSYLVNAARGGLVDESALYHSLASGHLAGAALDCFEQEPYVGPLSKLSNVLLTGHIGSYAREARVMMETQAAENLLRQLGEQGVLV